MNNKVVGKIKNISYNQENEDLELIILVIDPIFKRKILRDLSLSGNLRVEGEKIIFVSTEDEHA